MSVEVGVVLPAAGAGTRFGEPKQLLLLAGKPLVLHALEACAAVEGVRAIAVVGTPAELPALRELVAREASRRPDIAYLTTEGGARRQDSVLNGLRRLPASCEIALVHDAARPLVRADDIERLVAAIERHGAAVLGYPSVDSVKEAAGEHVERNLARENVWLVQTPQGARRSILLEALERATEAGFEGTDEASFLEWQGQAVALVEGSRENIKVTYPPDLALAEHYLSRR